VASLDFYKDVIAFARKHDIIVLSDLAYAEIYFDDTPPPSVLEVPGAMDICVEFTSMSKTFSMPGWRMGFAVGNERLISALTRVKSYLDYGAFTPIQVAATAALNGDGSVISSEVRSIYRKRRRDVLVDSFGKAGWEVPPPEATMFAWAPIPEPFKRSGIAGVLQASGRKGRRGGGARRGLRRTWRRTCPHRAGRKRAPHPPGGAQHQALPVICQQWRQCGLVVARR
jgi:aspartate/methionine/tyrosine aminotransferase